MGDLTRQGARRRFPGDLRRALVAYGVKQVELAASLGVRPTTVSEWCRGVRFPSMAQADGIAESLPGLAHIVIAAHTVECIVCGRTTVHGKGNSRARYCGSDCKATDHSRRRREGSRDVGIVARHRLAQHQAAVLAMCRACEPEGMCRDAGCALRPVSPLPLADGRLRVA